MITETFLSIDVADMQRAVEFYVEALGASVAFSSERWSSLRIAGVRVGLAQVDRTSGRRTGIHFVVSDLAIACDVVVGAGGRVVLSATEVAPGVFVADVTDPEGNTFTFTRA